MFYITISNGLLEGDHHNRMGNSVWLFMWLIDKVTKIDEDGWGWVLGGKPINLEEIQHIPRRSTQRYLAILKKEGYIEIIRTMRGIIIKVAKAKKRFQGAPKMAHHNDEPEMAHQDTKNGASQTKSGASNKTVSVDRTVDSINTIGATPSETAKNFYSKGWVFDEVVDQLLKAGMPRPIIENQLAAFVSYWTEPNASGKKQRWQLEKTFDVKRRLGTWLRNTSRFSRPAAQRKGIEV